MKIYAVNLMPINIYQFNQLIKFISTERKAKIYKYRRDIDKYRSLITEILIRNIICEELNINNEDVFFEKNKYGKPSLKYFENFHFNISHSFDWVICAIDNRRIGIDIEKIMPIDYKKLAQENFTEKECRFIIGADTNDKLKNFYRIWSLKESYVKADGRGLGIHLNSFTVDVNGGNIRLISPSYLNDYYFKEFNIDCEYKMSVCALHLYFPEKISIFSQDALINNFIRLISKNL